jgi:competence protein ComGF
MINKPARLHAITFILHSLHLVDPRLLRFADSQMDTQEKRERVYYAWVVFRHLSVDIQRIGELVQLHSIRLILIVGKRDMIITAQNMQRLLRHVNDYHLEILDTGHHGIIAGSIPTLIKAVSQ